MFVHQTLEKCGTNNKTSAEGYKNEERTGKVWTNQCLRSTNLIRILFVEISIFCHSSVVPPRTSEGVTASPLRPSVMFTGWFATTTAYLCTWLLWNTPRWLVYIYHVDRGATKPLIFANNKILKKFQTCGTFVSQCFGVVKITADRMQIIIVSVFVWSSLVSPCRLFT